MNRPRCMRYVAGQRREPVEPLSGMSGHVAWALRLAAGGIRSVREDDGGVDLEPFVSLNRWTPRAMFPPSEHLIDYVFSCGDGYFLRTNPDFGGGDPVYSVGWAESTYWAHRAWAGAPFVRELDLEPPPAQWPPPSLRPFGRPTDLSFASLRDFEKGQPGARKATLVHATYRFPDGAFVFCQIDGPTVNYYFGSHKPNATDRPVAIEFKLPTNG